MNLFSSNCGFDKFYERRVGLELKAQSLKINIIIKPIIIRTLLQLSIYFKITEFFFT